MGLWIAVSILFWNMIHFIFMFVKQKNEQCQYHKLSFTYLFCVILSILCLFIHKMKDATGIVITVGTTAFPTKRWSGGNTPQAIDQEAVTRIANIAAESSSLRRMVLLTSVGVQRTKQMPFLILNLFGVLDAKRAGEDAVKNAASKGNFSYSIVRPGRLVGGPYTNLDLAKLFQIEGGAENGVTLEKGDTLLGDCKRDVCAEAVLQCLENVDCVDVDFSMISNEEKALVDGEWGEAFVGMRGEQ